MTFRRAALVTAGATILLTSGLCTGAVAIPSALAALRPHNAPLLFSGWDMVTAAIVVGGPFMLAGGVMLFAGLRRRRGHRSQRRD